MTLCRSCGADFSATWLFDKHRVGKHTYLFTEGLRMDPPREDGRRCLDAEEMRGLGWEVDANGRWSEPARARATRDAFARVERLNETPRSSASPSEESV